MGFSISDECLADVASFPAATLPRVTRKTHRGPIFMGVLSAKYTDDETGLVMYQLRAYSPELGRFMSRDPAEEGGGVNLFSSCRNDTVSGVDPLGLVNIVVSGTDADHGVMSRGYQADSPVSSYLDYAGRYYFKHIGDGVWDFESVGSFMTPLAYVRKAWNFPVTAPAIITHSVVHREAGYLWNALVPNAFRRDVEVNGGRVADLIAQSKDDTDVILAHSQGVALSAAGVAMASRHPGVKSCKTIKMVLLAPKIQSGYPRDLINQTKKNQDGWKLPEMATQEPQSFQAL